MNTRTSLLNSAELAIRQRGYNGFSFADMARDVGIRKASIHYHFPTKADLALQLIDRYAAQFESALSEIDANNAAAADKLRDYQGVYRDALAGGSQLCLCVALGVSRENLADPVLTRLNQFHENSTEWLHRTFSAAAKDLSVSGLMDANAEAYATLALMEGAQLMARAAANTDPFDRATAAFLSRLSATHKS